MKKIEEYESEIINDALNSIPLRSHLRVLFQGYWMDRTPPMNGHTYIDGEYQLAINFAKEMIAIVEGEMKEFKMDIDIQLKDVK